MCQIYPFHRIALLIQRPRINYLENGATLVTAKVVSHQQELPIIITDEAVQEQLIDLPLYQPFKITQSTFKSYYYTQDDGQVTQTTYLVVGQTELY